MCICIFEIEKHTYQAHEKASLETLDPSTWSTFSGWWGKSVMKKEKQTLFLMVMPTAMRWIGVGFERVHMLLLFEVMEETSATIEPHHRRQLATIIMKFYAAMVDRILKDRQ